MLPSEIEPFADHHLEQLTEMLDILLAAKQNPNDSIPLDIDKFYDTAMGARAALNRFKFCMIDEHKMKKRLEDQRLHCRLHHRDQ